MRTPTAWSILVLAPFTIIFAAGCRNEVAVTLDEIEATQQEILSLLEAPVQQAVVATAAATAAEDNAAMALEATGLALDDNGRHWRTNAGTRRCSAALFFQPQDPLCSTWREARREVRRANSTLDAAQTTLDNRANRYARQLANFRRAHDDDTWDLMGRPGATGRSIVIARLRELEDERTRLENLAAEAGP